MDRTVKTVGEEEGVGPLVPCIDLVRVRLWEVPVLRRVLGQCWER